MSPEKLADSLARKARRRPLTPEQLSRAMEAEDFDLSGLDALYEALKARGVALAPEAGEEPDLPPFDEAQIGTLEKELSPSGVTLDDPVKAYLKEIGAVPLLQPEEEDEA